MAIVTEYRVSSYPDAKIGKHYSIDFRLGDGWFIRQLFWTRKEAEKTLKEIKHLKNGVDNS